MEQTLYEKLGVSPDATQDEITKAYRAKSRKLHPDAGGDKSEFAELSHAYEVLSDPEKRDRYDKTGRFGTEPSMIEATVASLTVQAFTSGNTNPLKWIQDQIDAQRSSYKSEKSKHESELKNIRESLSRFVECNSDTDNVETRDFMVGVLENQIASLEVQIENDLTNIKLGTDILAYLNGIRYTSPPQKSGRNSTALGGYVPSTLEHSGWSSRW